jgi:hypothetical protein
MLFAMLAGRKQLRRLGQKRARFPVGRQQAHHFAPKLGIVSAGVIEVRLASGWIVKQDLIEDRPQAPMAVDGLTHRPGSLQGDAPRSTRVERDRRTTRALTNDV